MAFRELLTCYEQEKWTNQNKRKANQRDTLLNHWQDNKEDCLKFRVKINMWIKKKKS